MRPNLKTVCCGCVHRESCVRICAATSAKLEFNPKAASCRGCVRRKSCIVICEAIADQLPGVDRGRVSGHVFNMRRYEEGQIALNLQIVLTPKQRRGVELFYRFGLKLREIGAIMGVGVSAISAHKGRAVRKVYQELEKQMV